MSIFNIAKGATSLVASAGVGVIVTNAIKATTPAEVSKLNKVLIAAGTFSLSGALGGLAGKYVADSFDEVADSFRTASKFAKDVTVIVHEDVKEDLNDAKESVKDAFNGVKDAAEDAAKEK